MQSLKEQEDKRDFVGDSVDVKLWNSDILLNPNIKVVHLPRKLAQDVLELLEEFADLCGDVPKVKPLTQHNVKLVPGAVPVC